MTITDNDGHKETVSITVTIPAIRVDKKKYTFDISDIYGEFEIKEGYGLSFSNSNESVLKFNDERCNDNGCEFELMGPGTAIITITDYEGNTETVEVTVEAPFVLDTYIFCSCKLDADIYAIINGKNNIHHGAKQK